MFRLTYGNGGHWSLVVGRCHITSIHHHHSPSRSCMSIIKNMNAWRYLCLASLDKHDCYPMFSMQWNRRMFMKCRCAPARYYLGIQEHPFTYNVRNVYYCQSMHLFSTQSRLPWNLDGCRCYLYCCCHTLWWPYFQYTRTGGWTWSADLLPHPEALWPPF